MEVAEPASGLEDYADGNNWPFNFTEFFNSLLNFNHFIMVFYFCLFLVLVFSNHYVNWIYHEKTTLDDILVKHEVKNLQNFDANYDLALEQKARWPIFWTSILLTLMSSGRVGFSFFYSCPFFPDDLGQDCTHQNHTHRRLGRCPVVSQFSLHLARERAT